MEHVVSSGGGRTFQAEERAHGKAREAIKLMAYSCPASVLEEGRGEGACEWPRVVSPHGPLQERTVFGNKISFIQFLCVHFKNPWKYVTEVSIFQIKYFLRNSQSSASQHFFFRT